MVDITREEEDQIWDKITARPEAQAALSRRADQLRKLMMSKEDDMATNEERLAAVEDSLTQTRAVGQTMLGIVKDIDGNVRSIQAHETIIDSRIDTVDKQIGAMKLDMRHSFQQVAATMATKQDLDEFKRDINARFDQVIALLTRKEE